MLPNGDVWAWQAKFLFALDVPELGQIGRSVTRALGRDTRLRTYFVLMPYDLPAGDTQVVTSAHTRWLHYVAAWKELAPSAAKLLSASELHILIRQFD